MSTTDQTLPQFVQSETRRFSRRFVGALVIACILALPAAVGILLFVPDAFGYLLISIAGLIMPLSSAFFGSSDEDLEAEFEMEDELEENDTIPNRLLILLMLVIYIVEASSFSTLLTVASVAGLAASTFDYPTVGIAIAAALPSLDKWCSHHIHPRCSLVAIGAAVAIKIVSLVVAVYSLPSEIVEQARRHRKDLY